MRFRQLTPSFSWLVLINFAECRHAALSIRLSLSQLARQLLPPVRSYQSPRRLLRRPSQSYLELSISTPELNCPMVLALCSRNGRKPRTNFGGEKLVSLNLTDCVYMNRQKPPVNETNRPTTIPTGMTKNCNSQKCSRRAQMWSNTMQKNTHVLCMCGKISKVDFKKGDGGHRYFRFRVQEWLKGQILPKQLGFITQRC